MLWRTELSHCLCTWVIKDNIGVKGPETISFFPFSPPFERLNMSNIPSPTTISNRKISLQAEFWKPFRQNLEESKNPIDTVQVWTGGENV